MEILDFKASKQNILLAIEETFENMLFMDAEYIEQEVDINDAYMIRILINHPFPGELVLHLPESLVVHMAMNLYMMDEEEVDYKVKLDLSYELTNTIAGRVMANMVPDNKTFKLGLPEITDSVFIEDDSESIVMNFVVDDDLPFKVYFYQNI